MPKLHVVNLHKVFEDLRGMSYSLRDFRKELARIRWEHLAELPADYSVSELLDFARDQQWFTEDESGKLHVLVHQGAQTQRQTQRKPKKERSATTGSQRR